MVQVQCAQRGRVTHSGQVVNRLMDGWTVHKMANPSAVLVARDGNRWGRWDGSAGPGFGPAPASLAGRPSGSSGARGSADPGPVPVAPGPSPWGSLGASKAILFTSRTADCRITG